MNKNIYMDIQYSPNFFTFFVLFVFLIVKTHFLNFFFFVQFIGVAWKPTEESIHFIVIWPYIHKANCNVFLFEQETKL